MVFFSLLQDGSKIQSSVAGCDPACKHQHFLYGGLEKKAMHEARDRGDPESSAQPTPSRDMNFAQRGFVIVSCSPRGTETLPSHYRNLSSIVVVFLIPHKAPMLLENRRWPPWPACRHSPAGTVWPPTPARGSGQLR